MSGRKAKPVAIKKAEGNIGNKKRVDRRRRTERFRMDAPRWLDQHARAKFCEIRDFLRDRDALEKIDAMMIAIASQDWSDWLAARRLLAKMEGANKFLIKNGAGVNGHPLVWVVAQKVESIRKFSALLGLTATDRSRLAFLDQAEAMATQDELTNLLERTVPQIDEGDVTIQ